MSFEEKITAHLESKRALYPAVKSIETGADVPNSEDIYIRVMAGDIEMIEAGAADYQPAKQPAKITILVVVNRNDNETERRRILEALKSLILAEIRGNRFGFLLNSKMDSLSTIEKDMHGKNEVLFCDIDIEGEYFL
jgi:hypothetical protein